MRILTEPKVYLLVRPSLVFADDRGTPALREFLADAGLEWPTPTEGVTDAERAVECAGRICYMSFGKKAGSKTNREYIDNLLGRITDGSFRLGPAHGSVVEHPTWSFIVRGAGRGFSHEQVRHRVGWAYSQLSTRYCDFEREESEGTWDPGFTIPPLAQLSSKTKTMFEMELARAREAYKVILSCVEADLHAHPGMQEALRAVPERDRRRALRKAARGAARDILPNATEAIMVLSANARALWNTIYLRASPDAEAEIRSVYVQLARIMEKEMPTVFRGLKYVDVWDGTKAVVLPREKL